MSSVTKIAFLGALVVVSIGLSIAQFGSSRVEAQAGDNDTLWIADDPPRAVDALLQTGSYMDRDHVFIPGMYQRGALPLNISGWATFRGMSISGRDGQLRYQAAIPSDPTDMPYMKQNPLPVILWTPTTEEPTTEEPPTDTSSSESGKPAIQLDGQGGTLFFPPDPSDSPVMSTMTSTPIKTDQVPAQATKFAIKLMSDMKTAKFAMTRAQLEDFAAKIREAQKTDGDVARVRVAGSINDKVARFVLFVRVRAGMARDFRILVDDDAWGFSPQ